MVRLGRRGLVLATVAAACSPKAHSPRAIFVQDVPACSPPSHAELGPVYVEQLLGYLQTLRELRQRAPLGTADCLQFCEAGAGICSLRQRSCDLVPQFPEVCEFAELCAAPDCDETMSECERCVAENALP